MKGVTACVGWDAETKLYAGVVPGIPGAHSQGATLDELHENLEEVVALCVEADKDSPDDLPPSVKLRQIELSPEEYGRRLEDL